MEKDTCNKTSYENEGLAQITADYINREKSIVKIYKCQSCGDWHLTSIN